MADAAKDIRKERLPDQAPAVGERQKTEEEIALEHGSVERLHKLVGNWETGAFASLHRESQPVIDSLHGVYPDLATRIHLSEKQAANDVRSATDETRQRMSRFVEGGQPVPEMEPARKPIEIQKAESNIVVAPVPPQEGSLHFEEPKDEDGRKIVTLTVEMLREEWERLNKIPDDKRTTKDNLRRGILGNQIAMGEASLKKFDHDIHLALLEDELSQTNERIIELMKRAPDNDVRFLPEEEKEELKQLKTGQREHEEKIGDTRAEITRIATSIFAIDQLLTKNTSAYRAILEEESAERTRREQEEAAKAAKRKEWVQRELERQKKNEKTPSKFKEGMKGAGVAAGIGAGVSLFGMGRIFHGIGHSFEWLDKKIEKMFNSDWVDTLGSILSAPERMLHWVNRKWGEKLGDTDTPKKHE